MKINKDTRDNLLKLAKERKIFLEGNIIKIIEIDEGDVQLTEYINDCKERDMTSRKKRLQVTKQVQKQNKELESAAKENDRVNKQLSKALDETEQAMQDAKDAERQAIMAKAQAEKATETALGDLDLIQKKSQFELIGTIVRVALFVIIGVGVLTTIMYGIAIINDKETQIIGSTWSNMFGILLTNAFSIVGTIMGVKYASENNKT
jgi:flagellar biosynthesis regulator FlaF